MSGLLYDPELLKRSAAGFHEGEHVFWYAYYYQTYAAPLNEYDEPQGSGRKEIRLACYKVVAETAKSVKVRLHGQEFWVRKGARVKKCYQTEEEARKHFLIRMDYKVNGNLYRAREARAFQYMAQGLSQYAAELQAKSDIEARPLYVPQPYKPSGLFDLKPSHQFVPAPDVFK